MNQIKDRFTMNIIGNIYPEFKIKHKRWDVVVNQIKDRFTVNIIGNIYPEPSMILKLFALV